MKIDKTLCMVSFKHSESGTPITDFCKEIGVILLASDVSNGINFSIIVAKSGQEFNLEFRLIYCGEKLDRAALFFFQQDWRTLMALI